MQSSVERNHFAVYFRAYALISDFGMNSVRVVDRRCVLHKAYNLAFGGENKHLAVVDVAL